MYCPMCGKPVKDGAKECRNCKTKFSYPPQKNKEIKRGKKRATAVVAISCVMAAFILIFVFILTNQNAFLSKKRINRKTYEAYESFDTHLAEISIPFYDDEGYVEQEKVEELFDTVEVELLHGIEEGIIADYSREDANNCIRIVYESGIIELFIPPERDVLSGNGDLKITTFVPTNSNLTTNTYTNMSSIASFFVEDFPFHLGFSPEANAEMITSSYPDRYSYNPIGVPRLSLHQTPYTGRYADSDATLDVVRDFGASSVIIWEGHGTYTNEDHSGLVTGQSKTWADFKKYKEDLKEGVLLVTNRSLSLEYIASVADSGMDWSVHYVITPKYVEKYVGNMDGALVFLGACNSERDSVLAESFIKKGAAIVYGYSQTVDIGYEVTSRSVLFYALSDGFTAGDALSYARELCGQTDGTVNAARLTAVYSRPDMADHYSLEGIKSSEDEEWQHIYTAEDLNRIRDNHAGRYMLEADIDLSGYDWDPIGGEERPFTGTLIGNGYTISNLKVRMESQASRDAGLFGMIDGGTVLGVHLSNVDIDSQVDSQDYWFSYAGGIAGEVVNGRILRCSVQGSIISTGKGNVYARAGGICGSASKGSIISNCSVDAYLKADAEHANTMTGGITAWLDHSEAENCFFKGTIEANNPSITYAGGINASGEDGTIKACVVCANSLNTTGDKQVVHPISYFATKENNLVFEGVTGAFSSTDEVVFVTPAEGVRQETYSEIGWDFDFVWVMTDTGPVLWKANW